MKDNKVKLTKDLKERARKVFKQLKEPKIWVNVNGAFFTSENLAMLSVKNDRTSILALTPEFVFEPPKPSDKKLVITTTDNKKIVFSELVEGDAPKEGDNAKIGNKNAQGTFKVDPQTSFVFDKGALKEIIHHEPKDQ
ncbi:hypothetical protein [Aquimarina latercula]|uniref:hypothetical protein n=1 Tax=Aquimarina latercula TaxID=987 RepID=UPI0004848609|nr:hypothetical protein [Aquimarina latercula]